MCPPSAICPSRATIVLVRTEPDLELPSLDVGQLAGENIEGIGEQEGWFTHDFRCMLARLGMG